MLKARIFYALCAGGLAVASVPLAAAAPQPALSEEQVRAQYDSAMTALEQQLHPKSGHIVIPEAKASLELGDSYYFLPAAEARRVLTEAWGNPAESVGDVLGMVFPAGKSFRDQTWGAVVAYEDTGHVGDKDAAEQDYDAVLAEMQGAAEEENEWRRSNGYPASHVVGWAQAPTYDPATKTLIWARNIKFEDSPTNTLNYDVRTLGRTGVLSLNMVDSMPNLAAVQTAAVGLGSTVSFDAGARYADYDPDSDATAEYGLAGLVAAGAGLGVAKKAGLLALLGVILKKGFVFVLAALAGIGAWAKRRYGGRYNESGYDPDA